MLNRFFIGLALLCTVFVPLFARAAAPALPTPAEDMARITERLRETMLSSDATELVKLRQAKGFMETLQADGSWADINYTDQNRVAWATARHLDRVLLMALAYRNPHSAFCGNKELAGKALHAYDVWFARKLTNPNGWWLELWQTAIVGNILLLLEPDATPEEIALGAHAMRMAGVDGRGGANLIGAATTLLIRGCLEKDPAAVRQAIAAIAQEVSIKDGLLHEPAPAETHVEGIQADHSFFQHGRILYTGGYGTEYMSDMARFVYAVSGTQFAFPQDKVALFDALILDGAQWMMRWRTFDWSTIGREITRRNVAPGHARQMIAVCELMVKVGGARQQEYQALLARLESASPEQAGLPAGNRYFWKADFMAHHRQAFYASVRLSSDRVRRTEMTNGEGTHSYYLSDGAMYVMRRGDEYTDIFPVWDWQRIPGITVEYDAGMNSPLSRKWGNYGMMRMYGASHFAGGVSDGHYGMAAMDFIRASYPYEAGSIYAKGVLQAKKSWFFFDQEVVCLGAGITHETDTYPVLTSINQCLLNGEVTVADAVGQQAAQPQGERVLENPQWVYHDGVAYLFPDKVNLHLKNDAQHGKWSDIGADPAPETPLDVFSLWINHGTRVADQRYCYLVVPGIALTAVEAYRRKGDIVVLSNTPQLQAVQHQELHMTQASFYQPGTLTTRSGLTLTVDQPCLLLAKEIPTGVQLTLANPENRPLTVQLHVNKPVVSTDNTIRWFAQQHVSCVTITLPDGLQAGSSVTRTLTWKK